MGIAKAEFMGSTLLYHNPRCSKSRHALQLLKECGIDFDVIEYLKQPLSASQTETLIKQLNEDASCILRDKECKDLGVEISSNATQVARIVAEHPKVMQRPIVVHGDNAVIGRPVEKIAKLLGI